MEKVVIKRMAKDAASIILIFSATITGGLCIIAMLLNLSWFRWLCFIAICLFIIVYNLINWYKHTKLKLEREEQNKKDEVFAEITRDALKSLEDKLTIKMLKK